MIFGLIGFINSGKDTVASHLIREYNCKQESFASSLKDACANIFDWPRALLEGDTDESRKWRENTDSWWAEKLDIPNFNPRLALQLIGTDCLRIHFNSDIWFLSLQNRIRKDTNRNIIISDVRFPNEVKFMKENNGVLIRINRGNPPVWYETALLANKGNSLAVDIMSNTYASVHHSEWASIGIKADFEIDNNGTIKELIASADNIFNQLLNR
jgi:hypothetical protein